MTTKLRSALFLAIVAVVTFGVACAGIQLRIKKFEQCTADKAIADASSAVGGAVSGALLSGAPNWKQQLDALAREFGGDAIACATQAFLKGQVAGKAPVSAPQAGGDGGAPLMAARPLAGPPVEQNEAASQRARSYLAELKIGE